MRVSAKKINHYESFDSQFETLKNKILKREDILSRGLNKKNVWFVYVQQESIGPFSEHDVRDFVSKIDALPPSVKFANSYEKSWLNIEATPFNDKYHLKVAEVAPTNEETFFILVSGIKEGPYSIEDLQQKIENKDLLMTSTISSDGGSSWMKVYEHPELDRRLIPRLEDLPAVPESFEEAPSEQELPPLPGQPESNFSEEIQEEQTNQEDNDLVNLAHMERTGTFHPKATSPKHETSSFESGPAAGEVSSKINTKKIGLVAIIIAAIAIVGFIFSEIADKFTLTPDTSVKGKQVKPQGKTPSQSKQTSPSNTNENAPRRSKSKEAYERDHGKTPAVPNAKTHEKTLTPVESQQTQRPVENRNLQNDTQYQDEYERINDSGYDEKTNTYPEERNFDNGQDPVEQDPVRSRLGKETIDPETEVIEEAFTDETEFFENETEAKTQKLIVNPDEIEGTEIEMAEEDIQF